MIAGPRAAASRSDRGALLPCRLSRSASPARSLLTVGTEWGLYLVTLATPISLVAGVWNAWMMMLGHRTQRTKNDKR